MHCIPVQDICFVQSKYFLCKIIKYNDFNFDDQAKNRYDKNIKQKLVKVLGDIKNMLDMPKIIIYIQILFYP